MRRVAYVCLDPGVPVFGRKGCSVHVQEWIRAAGRSGVEVELFAARFDGTAPKDLDDLVVHHLPIPKTRSVAERERAICAVDATLAPALERAGTFDLVYERHALFCRGAMSYAAEKRLVGLEEVNAPLVEEQKEHRDLVDEALARALRRDVFAAASSLVAVSSDLAKRLRAEAGETPIVSIPNGVNLERFHPNTSPRWAPPLPAFVAGFVGTLKAWHGLDCLVDAMSLLRGTEPRFHLLIVGDGPERTRLERRVAQTGMSEHTTFTGAVAPDEIPGYLAAMDAALAPYPASDPNHGFYFSPLKLKEYLAMGLPVVASRVGQIDESIVSGDNGLLISPGSAADLAGALKRLAQDPALARQLSQRARVVACQSSWVGVVRRTLALADALVSERRR